MLYWLKNAGTYDYVPFESQPQTITLSSGSVDTYDMTSLTNGGRRYPVMLLVATNNGTSDNYVELADLLEFSGFAMIPDGDDLLLGVWLAKKITVSAGGITKQVVVLNNKYYTLHRYYIDSSDVDATLYYVGYLNKD